MQCGGEQVVGSRQAGRQAGDEGGESYYEAWWGGRAGGQVAGFVGTRGSAVGRGGAGPELGGVEYGWVTMVCRAV